MKKKESKNTIYILQSRIGVHVKNIHTKTDVLYSVFQDELYVYYYKNETTEIYNKENCVKLYKLAYILHIYFNFSGNKVNKLLNMI